MSKEQEKIVKDIKRKATIGIVIMLLVIFGIKFIAVVYRAVYADMTIAGWDRNCDLML